MAANEIHCVLQTKENLSAGTRKIAKMFNCGRTQIQIILKNQESFTRGYEINAPATRKRLHRT